MGTGATAHRGYWAGVGRRLSRDRVAMVCAAILLALVLAALAAPWLGLADPYRGSIARRLRPIGFTTPQGFTHWLGTDEQGRDMLARLIYGARLSLFLGIVPVVNAFVIGKGGNSKPLISLPRGKGVKLSIAEERDRRIAEKKKQ
jgi:peptide/nickel transport system permease protein